MREFIDVTGKNEDEAIQKALAQLNMDRDDVSVEILERAKSGFLGFGGCPAKVRIYYGPEEEPVQQAAPVKKAEPAKKAEASRPAAPVQEATSVRQTEPARQTEPVRQTEPARRTAPPVRQRQERSKPAEKRPERQEVSRQANGARPADTPRPAPVPVDLGEEIHDEKAQAIRTFLEGLLKQMEAQAEIHVYQPEKGRYKVILEGKNMGALIGRRGETLDAIQQLTSYSVNRGGGGRVRVQLDAEGYREKREQSLQNLARKVASKVVKYRRSVTLEPMNAYERHVIHTALQEVSGVVTYSTGVEPNRRVIVAFDRSKK